MPKAERGTVMKEFQDAATLAQHAHDPALQG
jgi:hypothetical protein